jgi:hypothetical protein
MGYSVRRTKSDGFHVMLKLGPARMEGQLQ